MIILGNSIFERCPDCGEIVKLNKWLIGSTHLCVSDAEKDQNHKIGKKPYPKLDRPSAQSYLPIETICPSCGDKVIGRCEKQGCRE